MNTIKNAIGCILVAIGSGLLVFGIGMIDRKDIQNKLLDAWEDAGITLDRDKLKKTAEVNPHYITQACPFCGTNISVSTRTQQVPAHFDLRKTPCAVSGWNIEEAKELARATSK